MDFQRGFGIVATLFVIVVIGSASVMMVNVAGSQRAASLLALQSARAYSAADSGIEWAIARVSANVALCPPGVNTNLATLTYTANGLNGFIADVTCETTQHDEGGDTINVVQITSIGKFATAADASDYTRPDYVARELKVVVPITSP